SSTARWPTRWGSLPSAGSGPRSTPPRWALKTEVAVSDLLQANGEAPAAQAVLDGRAPDVAPDGVDLEYRRLFRSFGRDADGFISRDDLFARLRGCGILSDDPRIRETVETLNGPDAGDRITYAEFKRIARQNSSLIKNAIQGNL